MGSGWSSWPPSPTPGCWPRSWRRRWGCGRSLARRGPPPRRQRPTGWPASSATRFCWLSWTTASTWWPAAPSWSCGCCGPRRGCGCWPPAARSWGCRGSWSGRSRPWPSPTRHPSRDQGAAGTAPAQRCWPAMTGCGCSWSGPTWPTRASSSTATVDWSFQLREEPDRRLFRRLSVFAGGWTVAAAEAVTGDAGGVLEGLVRLVDRSLVVAVGGDPARFRMLETLRAYGADRLAEAGETELTAARHTAWFVDLAEEAATHRTGRRWTRRLEADYDNLRAAIDRAMAGGDHQTALRIGGALGWYWQEYHTEEGRQRLAGALALAEGEPPTIHLARTLLSSSMIELQRFPTLPEVTAARRSLELFERFGEPVGAATAKVLLALAELQHRGPSGDATRLVAEAGNGRGAIARARGDLERARQLHQEALGIVHEVLAWSVPHTLAQLGCAEARLGDLGDAEAHLREATGLVLDAPQPATAALVLVGHALVALGRGRPERAALLLATADATRDHAGVAPVGAERVEADLARRAVQDRLDPDAYRSAQAAGRELGTEEALRLARGPVPGALTKP